MSSTEHPGSVRPIGEHQRPPQNPRPPRLGLGIGLVLAGGLLGWGAASLGGNESSPATPAAAENTVETVVPRAAGPPPTVTWTAATTNPGIPAGHEYAGSSDAVEIDGTIYLAVNFHRPDTDTVVSSLWQSDDHTEWSSVDIEVGEDFVAYDLDRAGNSLLMTGSEAGAPAMYRSVAGRAIDGTSWNQVSLPGIAAIEPDRVVTVADSDGDTIMVAIGSPDIWRSIVKPLVPPGIDLNDPRYVLRSDGVVLEDDSVDGVDSTEVVIQLSEAPEVVATPESIWVRLVAEGGNEVLQTVTIPDGAYAVDPAPALDYIPLRMAWRSGDGTEFVHIKTRNALPPGFSTSHPWGDRFLTATYDQPAGLPTEQRATLWDSAAGRAWRPVEPQPPAACAAYSVATSGTRIHLTGEGGTQCVRSGDSPWEVLPDPSEAAYVIGGRAGFIGYPNGFEYDSALFSRDGIVWTEIVMPGLAPYPTVSILENRLVALSVNRPRPNRPSQIQVWVGKIGS